MYNYWTLLNTNADHRLIACRIIVTVTAVRVAASAAISARLVLMRQLNRVAIVAVNGEWCVTAHWMMVGAAAADNER